MSTPQGISIGKLAKATGFSVERLRMWELRYGAPQSLRLESGHRRYQAEEVERLHLVREALQRGMRPRHIVALDRDGLLKVLGEPLGGSPWVASSKPDHGLVPWTPKLWVAAASRMDDAFLDRQFYEHWLELGSLRFLTDRVQPFIVSLGQGWEKGELCVAEEHFGSEKMGDFLSGIWRRLNENNHGAPVLLTTLPGDTHRLGLQMAALVAAMAGLRVIYLGPSTPIEEVALAAGRQRARGVFLSLSLGAPANEAQRQLKQMRELLPSAQVMGIGGGGAGAVTVPAKVQRFQDLPGFYHWARDWGGEAGSGKGTGAMAGHILSRSIDPTL